MANEGKNKRVAYPGPHAEIVLKNVPNAGDETRFERGKAVELPEAVALDLIRRKKVKDTPRDASHKGEAPATDTK